LENADPMANAQTDDLAVADHGSAHLQRPGWLRMLERIILGALTMILTFNVWTGLPVAALWIGSRFAFGNNLSMGAIVVVLISLGVLMYICLRALALLSHRYDRVTGRKPLPRQPAPWLLSMSADAATPDRPGRRDLNAVETIVILTVVVAFVAFEVWFFVFAKAGVPS
jgi:hypothetical protein